MAGRGSGAFRRTKRRGNLTLAEFCGTVANWYEFYIRGNRRRLFVFVALIVRSKAHPLNTIFFRFRTRFWDKMSWPSSKILCESGGVERMLFGEFWVFRNIIAGGVEITSSRVSQYNTSTAG